jgi:sensor histidine kinase regulating citrate/malate metabolism
MQVLLVALVVAGCALFTYVSDRRQARTAAERQVTAAALAIAAAPTVREAIGTAEPSRTLQPYAEKVRREAELTFVTIMSPAGIRYTHPTPARIGERFLGHRAEALRGRTFSETYRGTLGVSVRVVTPVEEDGRVTGLVSAGIDVAAISERLRHQVLLLLVTAAAALLLGGTGTYVVNRRLRRHTHGMNATELALVHDYHEAALHAVREGLLLLDGHRAVALLNDGARELLGLPPGRYVGLPVTELGLPRSLTGALLASAPRVDEVHLTEERVLVVNTSPVSGGQRSGTVVTLRDHTELRALMGELDAERSFGKALRAQAHEAANRLHTVVSLVELGRPAEAVEFATAELELAQALTDRMTGAVGEPVLAALLLGRTAYAHEHGVELVLSEDSGLDDGLLPASLPPRDLVTILGNLVDNAVEAAQGTPGARVTVTARAEHTEKGTELLLRVSDNGPGIDPAHTEDAFRDGWSTKAAEPGTHGLGLALVRQAAGRAGGSVVARRRTGGGTDFTVRLPLNAQAAR